MTNYEFLIQKENIRDLAKHNIRIVSNYYYDRNKNNEYYTIDTYTTCLICSDGEMFFGKNLSNLTKEEWEKAIDYEIEWLNKEKL